MKHKKCYPDLSNKIYSSLVHPSDVSGKLDLTANSDFSGISSSPPYTVPARGLPSSNAGLSPRPTSAAARQRPGRLGTREGGPAPTAKFPAAPPPRARRSLRPAPRPDPDHPQPAASRRAEGCSPGGSRAWREEARALTLPPTSRGHPREASPRGCHDTKATLRASDLGHRSPAKQGTPARMQAGAPQTGARRGTVRACAPPLPAPRTPPAPARSRAFARL